MGKRALSETENLKMQFGMWLGLPKVSRKEGEKTYEEFAEKLGVSRETLWSWKKDKFVHQVAENAFRFYGESSKIDVINAMIDSAKSQGARANQDRRLYMEWQGEIGKNKPDPSSGNFTFKIVTDDK